MNDKHQAFSVAARVRSMAYAFTGVAGMLRDQHNAWIHCLATFAVLAAGFLFGVSRIEWLALIFAITLVWVAEALNTAFEYLCDVASPEFHPLVEKSKDIAAGAVLLASLGAVAVGVVVFLPYLLAFF